VNQKLFQAKVYVSLKKGLADPQGSTIKEALESLGYRNLSEVRFGKYIEVKLRAKGKQRAEYSYHIEEEG